MNYCNASKLIMCPLFS